MNREGLNPSSLNEDKSLKIGIQGDSGDRADVIATNGNYGVVAIAPGHVSTDNSTTEVLGVGEVFTGEWEDIVNFGVIVVSLKANVDSSEDGLMLEFSSDGTVDGIISDDNYTYLAGTKKTFSFQAAARFYRVVFTNGGTIQGTFKLQTILKPYYVKPSSHRIQDSIVDDDDAELIKSVLTGEDELTGVFDNVSTYRKALNVNPAFVHRKIVNETFHQHTAVDTTPSVAISGGDTSITVTDPTGFIVGGLVKLSEGPLQEIGLMTITGVAASVITLDRPIGNDYTTGALVEIVIKNMKITGTLLAPQIFEVDPPPGTIWQLTRLLISIVHSTTADDSKFGSIAALTNGVALRATTAVGRTVVFANWKANRDMKLDMYDVEYSDKAGGGNFGTAGRWTFTTSEIVAELDGDASPIQKMEVLIQDDLDVLGIVSFEMSGQGRVFSP